ncbi:MAG: hypothetical protein AAGF11_25220 [Myxococcota bacterium]
MTQMMQWSRILVVLSAGVTDGCVGEPPPLPENTGTVGVTESGSAAATRGSVGTTVVGPGNDGTGQGSGALDGSGTTAGVDAGTGNAGTLWCRDVDMDGFGDPDNCETSEVPIKGSVDNADDCDDLDANTFPGAAPNDELRACMRDEDDDDFGDDFGGEKPPEGIEAGTDCIDTEPAVFPGSAELEMPPNLCTSDQDGDGYGDETPPKGATPGTDCLDTNMSVFPGAASMEDPPDLCAQDEDGDGWGDIDPPSGVEPGTDCDDMDGNTHPGSAENEDDSALCMTDADGDGWGDANPRGGAIPGGDCYDGNIDLNPDTLTLTAFLPYLGNPMAERTLATVVTEGMDAGELETLVTLQSPMGQIPNIDLSSATINESGEIYANDQTSVQLQTIAYDAAMCAADVALAWPVGMTSYGNPGDVVCGLEFGGDGMLYGIDEDSDLLTFDPATGHIVATTLITFMGIPLNISSCGMAYDCTQDRLLVANGVNQTIYSIDPTTVTATVVRNLDADFNNPWDPAGLAYDPTRQMAFISVGSDLFEVELNSMMPPLYVGTFAEQVSNLQYLPNCM